MNFEEGAVLTGGSYVVSGNGQINFIDAGTFIATLEATVIFDGGELEITTNGNAMQDTLLEIGSDGKPDPGDADASFNDTAAGGLDVAGTVSLGGGISECLRADGRAELLRHRQWRRRRRGLRRDLDADA